MGSDLGHGQHRHYNMKLKRTFIISILCLGVFCIGYYVFMPCISKAGSGLKNGNAKGQSCDISFGTYNGYEYFTKEGGTVGTPHCLVESKWMKVQQHSVRIPGSESGSVIDDWLWIDYHDRINVLVQAEATSETNEKQFLVFEQSKYALEGRTSLAIIGGIIEPGEQPEQTARREVREEIGNGFECLNYHFLGRFRTDVNRGMGWVNSFLATECSYSKQKKDSSSNANINRQEQEEVGARDTERQDLKVISRVQLLEAARRGEFLEVQWTATVSLALLHPKLGDN